MTGFGPVQRGYLGLGKMGVSNKQLRKQDKPALNLCLFSLVCVYLNKYFTLSISLDSFLFSSESRTLSRSYFSLYSASNSSRSLWLEVENPRLALTC